MGDSGDWGLDESARTKRCELKWSSLIFLFQLSHNLLMSSQWRQVNLTTMNCQNCIYTVVMGNRFMLGMDNKLSWHEQFLANFIQEPINQSLKAVSIINKIRIAMWKQLIQQWMWCCTVSTSKWAYIWKHSTISQDCIFHASYQWSNEKWLSDLRFPFLSTTV